MLIGLDKVMVVMLDFYECDFVVVLILFILVMKVFVERNGMFRVVVELLLDDSVVEVCWFVWIEFKNGSCYWLVVGIVVEVVYCVFGLFYDDWDVVFCLLVYELIEGLFWWELLIEVGWRWIQEVRGVLMFVVGLLGLLLEMSGVVEFQDVVCDLFGLWDELWVVNEREGLFGFELGMGCVLYGGCGFYLCFSVKYQCLQLVEFIRVECCFQCLYFIWKDGNVQVIGYMGGCLGG